MPVHVEHRPVRRGRGAGRPDRRRRRSPPTSRSSSTAPRVDLGSPYRVAGEQGTADTGVDTDVGRRRPGARRDRAVQLAVTYDGLTQTARPGHRRARGRRGGARSTTSRRRAARRPAPSDGFDRERRAARPLLPGQGLRTHALPARATAGPTTAHWLVAGTVDSVDSVDVDGTSYDVETHRAAADRRRCRRRSRRPERTAGADHAPSRGLRHLGLRRPRRRAPTSDHHPRPGARQDRPRRPRPRRPRGTLEQTVALPATSRRRRMIDLQARTANL